MKLLAFSDLHRDREEAERLVELARAADVAVGAVCGHIHESWGQEATIGRTPVVNLGSVGRFFEV